MDPTAAEFVRIRARLSAAAEEMLAVTADSETRNAVSAEAPALVERALQVIAGMDQRQDEFRRASERARSAQVTPATSTQTSVEPTPASTPRYVFQAVSTESPESTPSSASEQVQIHWLAQPETPAHCATVERGSTIPVFEPISPAPMSNQGLESKTGTARVIFVPLEHETNDDDDRNIPTSVASQGDIVPPSDFSSILKFVADGDGEHAAASAPVAHAEGPALGLQQGTVRNLHALNPNASLQSREFELAATSGDRSAQVHEGALKLRVVPVDTLKREELADVDRPFLDQTNAAAAAEDIHKDKKCAIM